MGVDGTKKLRRRLSMLSSVLAGMSPPLPALSVLRRDVQAAQHWLDQTLKDIKELQTQPSGRPPDENRPESRSASERRIKNTTKFKELSKDFLKRSFETDQLLSHSHAWLDQDNYSNTTFDLDIARLEYTWSQVRDELSNLAREYSLEEVEADLTRDLSAQGGDGFSPSPNSSYIPRSQLLSRRRTDPDGEQGHQPKQKRRFVPHLTWQYRAVIKSNVKFKDRTPRGSILGSEASESGSVYSDPLFSVRRRRDSQSSSSLSLPTVIGVSCVGVGSAGGSYTSLPSPASDGERLPTLRPGYKDNPSSDSLVSRDLNSNTVRVKQQVKATRSHRRPRHREPSNQLSLVKYGSDSSSDTKVIYVDLSSPTLTSRPGDTLTSRPGDTLTSSNTHVCDAVEAHGMEDYTKLKDDPLPAAAAIEYPVKSRFSRLTRSAGVHEGLTTLTLPNGAQQDASSSTPVRYRHDNVQTPHRNFHPPDVSTPISDDLLTGVNRCPQTPVEIRKFLGTNNSGAGRLSPDGQITPDFSENSSNMSSLAHSPTVDSQRQVRKDLKRRYQKDELWRAIKSDYHYLMDEDIIEQCRSTDSDLSWDDEEVKNAVTFTDFIQQYNELMEWLNQIQVFTQRQGSSLSEKYLNQSYYEEMLERSPRRKLFNDYAKQLMRRYPNMKDEISVRLSHLNNQWERLQKTIAPSDGLSDRETMLRDLALDLQGLETWLNRIESTLRPQPLSPSLSLKELRTMLKDHQVLQQDIECHSKVVSAVLKLCERLHTDLESVTSPSEELQITALTLERRWHSIWLQSLEWQCRLEEAVKDRESLLGRSFNAAHTRGLRNSGDQSDSRLHLDSDDSESGIQNDQSSQISENSNAQTVTHDKATSPGTSTLGRPKKVNSGTESQTEVFPVKYQCEVDDSYNYLELPDPETHILVVEEDRSADVCQVAVRPKQGLVRHWSESTSQTGVILDRQLSTERKRRYSDSAHISIDSPDASPVFRSRSLDDLSKYKVLAATISSGSLDRISDDSDALFDETAELLKSVASELRTYESYSDDEDEFFVYSKEAVDRSANSILAKYQNLEAGLQSVLEEESEGSEDMSSPKRLPSHSPGERVFSSPKVKKFLQLQSFSNTISPSLTPPETKRDSNLESEAHFLLEEGQLSVGHGGQLVVDNNLNLSNDLSQLPEHALDSLTVSRLSSHSSSPKPGGLVVGPLALESEHMFYRVEEIDARLHIVSSRSKEGDSGVDNECQLTQSEYSTEEYQSSSSSACEVVSSSASEIVSGFLRLNRYSNTEDLSKLTFDDSPADSDMEDINQNSRLSLSPSDLRACTPPPSTKNSTTEAIYVNISSADGLKADVNLQDAVPLSQLPTMSIIVQSNCRKSPECTVSTRDVTHLKHSTPQHVDLTPQHVDLTPRVGLTNISGPLRSPKVTPKLGPSSITVSGVSAHETVAQPPSRKYRRVTCRRLASESSDVISRHIESPQTLYKSYITVPRSSPSNTSSTDSTLRLSSQTTNTRSQSIASPASMICRESFILKRQSKVTDLYQTHVNISSAGSIIVAPPRHVSDKDSRLQPACGTSVSHPPTHEAERFLSSFSILRGQPTNHSHLSHAHGSCNHSLSTSAIWERNVGLPPNWSGIVVHQPSGDGRETHSDVTRISRSRASSESYSTGYLTPTRNYVKVLSMESAEGEPAEYREAIYINPSEVTKTSQEVVTTPTSSASPVELVSNAVKGVQCLVTSVKPAGNLYKDDSRSDVTGSDVTGSVAAGSDVTGSDVTSLIVDAGEKEEDKSPSQEFTRVCLERNVQEPVNSQPASRLPQHLKERFTSEASLSCEPGAYIAYNPEDVRGSKFHGRYEPARRDVDQAPLNRASVVLPRTQSTKSQEKTTPTKLQFTTSSTDNSGDSLATDLKSRQAKAGTVYRILDNGDVVCESQSKTNSHSDSYGDTNDDTGKETGSSTESQMLPLDSHDGEANSSTDNQMLPSDSPSEPSSGHRGLNLIQELLPGQPTSSNIGSIPESSSAQDIIDELNAGEDDDAMAVVSLFDLITGMTIPESTEEIPHTEQTEDVPHTEQTEDVPHTEQTEDGPFTEQSECMPHTEQTEDGLHTEQSEGMPHSEQSEEIPHTKQTEDFPHAEHGEDIPHREHSKDIPDEEQSEDTPHTKQEEDILDFPHTGHGKDFPHTEHGEDSPHTERGENFPHKEHDKDFPHKEHGEDFPHTGHGKDFPHTEHGEDFPHTERGGNFPHTERGENFPHKEHEKDFPHAEHDKNFPHAEHDKDFPHAEHDKDFPHTEHDEDFPHAEHDENFPHAEHDKNFPHAEHDKNFPQTEYGEDFPHTENGEDFPRTEHGGNFPHREHGEDFPHKEHGEDIPGKEQSEYTPHTKQERDILDFPHTEHDKDLPHTEHDKNFPHTEHNEDFPHTGHGEDFPHTEHGEDIPGKEQSEDTPHTKQERDILDLPHTESSKDISDEQQSNNFLQIKLGEYRPHTEYSKDIPQAECPEEAEQTTDIPEAEQVVDVLDTEQVMDVLDTEQAVDVLDIEQDKNIPDAESHLSQSGHEPPGERREVEDTSDVVDSAGNTEDKITHSDDEVSAGSEVQHVPYADTSNTGSSSQDDVEDVLSVGCSVTLQDVPRPELSTASVDNKRTQSQGDVLQVEEDTLSALPDAPLREQADAENPEIGKVKAVGAEREDSQMDQEEPSANEAPPLKLVLDQHKETSEVVSDVEKELGEMSPADVVREAHLGSEPELTGTVDQVSHSKAAQSPLSVAENELVDSKLPKSNDDLSSVEVPFHAEDRSGTLNADLNDLPQGESQADMEDGLLTSDVPAENWLDSTFQKPRETGQDVVDPVVMSGNGLPGDESANPKQNEGKTSVTDTSSCTAEQLNDQPKEEILSDSPKSAESSIGVHDSPLESYLSSGVEELMASDSEDILTEPNSAKNSSDSEEPTSQAVVDMVGDKRPDGSDTVVPGISQQDPTLLTTQEYNLSLDNLADPNASMDNQSSPISEEMALPTRKYDETQPALSSKDTVESDEADDLERFSQLSEQTEETAVASPAGNHESPSPVVAHSHQTDSTVDGADSVDCANLPFTEKPVLPFASATQPLVTEQSPKQPLITDQLPSQDESQTATTVPHSIEGLLIKPSDLLNLEDDIHPAPEKHHTASAPASVMSEDLAPTQGRIEDFPLQSSAKDMPDEINLKLPAETVEDPTLSVPIDISNNSTVQAPAGDVVNDPDWQVPAEDMSDYPNVSPPTKLLPENDNNSAPSLNVASNGLPYGATENILVQFPLQEPAKDIMSDHTVSVPDENMSRGVTLQAPATDMHVYPAALANEESLSNRTDHQAFVKDKPTLQALADSVPDNENMSGEPTLQAPATNTSVDPTVLVPGLNRPHSLTEDARELSVTDLTRAPALRVTESDSEACDGDESSEGEDDSPRPDNSWSSLAVEIPQLSPQLTSQEAVDDSSKRLVTDQKHSPAKRRRKRRPKAFTGSPKLSASGSPPAPSTPSVANQNSDDELPGQYSANHESDGGSHDQQSANQESDDNDYSDVVSSDNDDLLNSTGLSEGSNWDYYQDPPYSTGTEPDLDIDLEPKLDDSVLQWDDELDDNNATLTLDVQPREPRLMAHAAAANDSEDSDIEDLHYVIQQSSTQLLQADSALRKPRKDVVQCGVYLDPQKYLEWHATCQTNIKCLQTCSKVIQEHLESEQGLANLTDDDIQQVLDLISKWQSLEKLALQRKEQSASLCKMYRDIMAGKNQVKLADEQTSVAAFNDVGELEGHFRSLQTFRVNLQSQTHKLQQISDSMLVFESENKKIKMAGFKKLLSELSSEIKPAILNVGKRTTDLQYAVVQWHKWNTDCKELETHLVKTSFDIETVELGLCEQKLVELEASFSDFSSVCTAAAHSFTEEKLANLRLRLSHLMADREKIAGGVDTVPTHTVDDVQAAGLDDTGSGSASGAWTDDNATVVSRLTPPPSLLLEVSPEETLKSSSLESGLVTMDTERSVPQLEVTADDTDFSKQEELQPPGEEPTGPEVPPAGGSAADVSAKDTSSAASQKAMAPLVVDVSVGDEPGTADKPTPPSVEDLAPTLPITDQEKIHVANRSKKNKRNRRKGKNKNQSAATTSKPKPLESSANISINQSQQSSIQSPNQSQQSSLAPADQSTTTDFATPSVDSSSNTRQQTESSQTDFILTSDQSTTSDSQMMRNQESLTEPTLTRVATNQTESLSSANQSTSTESWRESVGNQTEKRRPDSVAEKFTNTQQTLSLNAALQTDNSSPLNVPSASSSAQTDSMLSGFPSSSQVDNSTQSVDSPSSAQLPIHEEVIPALLANQETPNEMLANQEEVLPELLANQEAPRNEMLDDPLAVMDENLLQTDRPVVEENIVASSIPRHRKPVKSRDETTPAEMSPVGESAKKPAARKRWLTSRLIRYLSTMMGALLFFIVIFFLLEPKCCENTQYHKGIFGLRKHYSQLPPH